MNYKVIDKEKYYRKGVFRYFTEDCKCSTSMTARINVTELAAYSKKTGTQLYYKYTPPYRRKRTQLVTSTLILEDFATRANSRGMTYKLLNF